MANKRVNMILVAFGFKGTGKTRKTLEIIGNYVSPKDGSSPRKVLIFDTNQEYTQSALMAAGLNYSIKAINIKDIPLFNKHPKVEACRILPINKDGRLMSIKEKKEAAWHVMQTFRGGLVVLDDINSYVLNVTHEEEFVGTIMNNSHRGQDVLIQFQSASMLNPVLIRNLDMVRMHYQIDLISDKFGDRVELYSIAKNIVEEKYNMGQKYFYVYIDNHTYKIIGNFNKRDFALACYNYILKQNPKLIKQEQSRLKTKDTIAPSAEAIKYLFRYYGNKI